MFSSPGWPLIESQPLISADAINTDGTRWEPTTSLDGGSPWEVEAGQPVLNTIATPVQITSDKLVELEEKINQLQQEIQEQLNQLQEE